jgi:hypothetical protein
MKYVLNPDRNIRKEPESKKDNKEQDYFGVMNNLAFL